MGERYKDIACRLLDDEDVLRESIFGKTKVNKYRLEHEKEYEEFYKLIKEKFKKEFFDEIYYGDYYYGAEMNDPFYYSMIDFRKIKSKIDEIIDSHDVLFYLQLYSNDLNSRISGRDVNGSIENIPHLTIHSFFQWEILRVIDKMYPFR